MEFLKADTRKEAEAFRTRAYTSAAATELTQTEIAAHAGIEQNTWSSWLNPFNGKNVPAFIIPLLPSEIATDLVRHLADRIGHALRKKPEGLKTNGSTDDELISIDELQGEFIALRKKDPPAARRRLEKMREMIDQLDLEMKSIEKK